MLLEAHKISHKKKPACTLCGDMRFVVPVTGNIPQRAVPCVCFVKLIQQSQTRLPPRMQTMTFGACPWRHDISADVFNRCREFAWEPNSWICLTGGSRRTYLAAAIANVRLAENLPVELLTTPDFLDKLRSTFDSGKYDQTFRAIRACPLLVLLDIGCENSTGWSQEKLYQLLQYRYYHELPLLLTTSQTPAALPRRLTMLLSQHPDYHSFSVESG